MTNEPRPVCRPRERTADHERHTTVTSDELIHAGAGTGLFLVQLSAIIPGLLPTLVLLGVLGAVAALPLIAVGLVGATLLGAVLMAGRGVRAATSLARALRASSPAFAKDAGS